MANEIPRHTPGEWRAYTDDGCCFIEVDGDGNDEQVIASFKGPDRFDNISYVVHVIKSNEALTQENQRLRRERDNLLSIIGEALRQSGCDGDLCLYEWHERARTAMNDAQYEW